MVRQASDLKLQNYTYFTQMSSVEVYRNVGYYYVIVSGSPPMFVLMACVSI